MQELNSNSYSEDMQNRDKLFVIKKFGLKSDEFECLMNITKRDHLEFKTEIKLERFFNNTLILINQINTFFSYLLNPIKFLKYLKYKFYNLRHN